MRFPNVVRALGLLGHRLFHYVHHRYGLLPNATQWCVAVWRHLNAATNLHFLRFFFPPLAHPLPFRFFALSLMPLRPSWESDFKSPWQGRVIVLILGLPAFTSCGCLGLSASP